MELETLKAPARSCESRRTSGTAIGARLDAYQIKAIELKGDIASSTVIHSTVSKVAIVVIRWELGVI